MISPRSPNTNDCTQAQCQADTCASPAAESAELLNQQCYCQTLDRARLSQQLQGDQFSEQLLAQHPQLFSSIATFISQTQFDAIKATVSALEVAMAAPEYQAQAMAYAPANANYNPGTAGVFMGFDFHLEADTPRLIEINTNAGGAFLNALLLSAQSACCPPMEQPMPWSKASLYHDFIAMFEQEWRLQRGSAPLNTIAIVDSQPSQQFLYPEFQIAQRLFQARGYTAYILAPEQLSFHQGKLSYQGQVIDLVYNRLTDFALTQGQHQPLNHAYQSGAFVLTPNPHQHALYADKRNLILLSDGALLAQLALSDTERKLIGASVPRTQRVTGDNAEQLWQARKQLFFKPYAGYGGRATYRGDKLTKSVWQEIIKGDYIAQQLIAPSERGIQVDGKISSFKMDLRAYAYQGKVQLLAARLYQGQTTNFRTQGGGFSPVFII